MAVFPPARSMACKWPPRLQLLCGCGLASLLAVGIDAMRLNRGAVSSAGAMLVTLSSKASTPLVPDSAAARAQRERDLRVAEDYLDSINIKDYVHLWYIKNTLERLEGIRERVLSFGAARDARHRLQIRNILRRVREQGQALKVRADKLEAAGQVDDGGDVLPTQRDNICSRIGKYRVASEFVDLVQGFCASLDTVRKAVNAGEDEGPTAYSVSGMLIAIAKQPDYRPGNIRLEIEQVLGEERRWLAKHLAPRPVGTGNDLPSPEGTATKFRTWALRSWEPQIWQDAEVDTAALPFKALKDAHDILLHATVEDNLLLSSVRTRIQRIDFCRAKLAGFIAHSDPAFREQIRGVFQEMEARMHALRSLAARKVTAGEVDIAGKLLPSQRENVCSTLDAFGLEEIFREDVRKICETLDRLHITVKAEGTTNTGTFFELLGRMADIRRTPGYSDTPVASELENLLAEEWNWLEKHAAEGGT